MAFTVHITHQIGFTKIIMKILLTEKEGCTQCFRLVVKTQTVRGKEIYQKQRMPVHSYHNPLFAGTAGLILQTFKSQIMHSQLLLLSGKQR